MVARIGMTLPHQARRKQLSHPYDHNGTHKSREYFEGNYRRKKWRLQYRTCCRNTLG